MPFIARSVAGTIHIPIGVISVALLFAFAAYPMSGRVTSPSQRADSRSRNGEIAARTRRRRHNARSGWRPAAIRLIRYDAARPSQFRKRPLTGSL
jgi:hypothetical protein